MAYKIIVKKRFTSKLIKLLYYLESGWGKTVANRFENKLEKRLDNLSIHPLTGAESEYFKKVRSILITKHNRLYYRIKETTVEVINMYDTRMNPKKNPYKKK
ncbi:MAG: type II toxin-antitoxin system RelE/ParE family toxin [Bacteroidota bacterium]|nr:type II toxin-antitoxin system RelE/ParE family toxin [Bacteroidota bacterium]